MSSILGCATTHATRPGTAAQRRAGNLDTTAARSTALPEYRIGILDELEVRVRYHERLNETVKVRPDGRITLENFEEVYVAGMTPAEFDQAITKAYAAVVHDPDVTVFVRGFAGLSVYVLGEVDKPGMVEMKPNMTALQAITVAGGPVRGAKLNSVMVLRRDGTGEYQADRLDLSRSAINQVQPQDQYLRPQDLVYVPRTFISNVNDFLAQIYDGLFPPFDIYLRALREYNRDQ